MNEIEQIPEFENQKYERYVLYEAEFVDGNND